MSLQRYRIDLRKLPSDEREKLYTLLENRSFIISIDLNNIGIYEVFWKSSIPIEESISFPKPSIITKL
ncbi:hypothetical protein ACQPUL_08275 [Clostridium butyricum]|uniref:hypothetical protein n=1 Tax=Clostridium butyricum TaxID=1492 RepID=UPI003D32F333